MGNTDSHPTKACTPLDKGDTLFALAEREMKTNVLAKWFDAGQDDRINKYVEAAAQYKIAKAWHKAHLAHQAAARLALENKDVGDAIQDLQLAAQCLAHDDLKGAILLYKETIGLQKDQGKFGPAGKLWKKIAEIQEVDPTLIKDCIDSWQEAYDCFVVDESKIAANEALLRKANLLAVSHDVKGVKEAISIYEQVASEGISKYAVKDYLFRSGLLSLLLEVQGLRDRKVHLRDKLQFYKDEYPIFEGSRECVLLDSLVSCLVENKQRRRRSGEEFRRSFRNYERITKLDAWSTKILLQIKNQTSQPSILDEQGEIDLR